MGLSDKLLRFAKLSTLFLLIQEEEEESMILISGQLLMYTAAQPLKSSS